MNYSRIYEALIARAQSRPRPEGYVERHHILPRCMGGSDDESNLVALTAREHYVAHLLLANMYPRVPGLWVAIHIMSGKNIDRVSSWWYRKVREICLPAWVETGRSNGKVSGRINGKKAFELKIGIHDPEMQLKNSKAGGKIWGKKSFELKVGIHASGVASSGGKKATELKLGIHGLTKEQRSVNGKKFGAIGGKKGGKRGGEISGRKMFEQKKGVHNRTKEQMSERGKKGGKIGGKVSGAQRFKCLKCGMITGPGPLGTHQKSSGHTGKEKVS